MFCTVEESNGEQLVKKMRAVGISRSTCRRISIECHSFIRLRKQMTITLSDDRNYFGAQGKSFRGCPKIPFIFSGDGLIAVAKKGVDFS